MRVRCVISLMVGLFAFCLSPAAVVDCLVWLDLDGDGDSIGENLATTGFADWRVFAERKTNDVFVAYDDQLTDEQGGCRFENLPPGSYRFLAGEPPPYMRWTTPFVYEFELAASDTQAVFFGTLEFFSPPTPRYLIPAECRVRQGCAFAPGPAPAATCRLGVAIDVYGRCSGGTNAVAVLTPSAPPGEISVQWSNGETGLVAHLDEGLHWVVLSNRVTACIATNCVTVNLARSAALEQSVEAAFRVYRSRQASCSTNGRVGVAIDSLLIGLQRYQLRLHPGGQTVERDYRLDFDVGDYSEFFSGVTAGAYEVEVLINPTADPALPTYSMRLPIEVPHTSSGDLTHLDSAMAMLPASISTSVVTVVAAGCDWQIAGLPAWLHASQTNGSGTASIHFVTEPNALAGPRHADLFIGDQPFTLFQAGPTPLPPPAIDFLQAHPASSVQLDLTSSSNWPYQVEATFDLLNGPWQVLRQDQQAEYQSLPLQGARRYYRIRWQEIP